VLAARAGIAVVEQVGCCAKWALVDTGCRRVVRKQVRGLVLAGLAFALCIGTLAWATVGDTDVLVRACCRGGESDPVTSNLLVWGACIGICVAPAIRIVVDLPTSEFDALVLAGSERAKIPPEVPRSLVAARAVALEIRPDRTCCIWGA